MIGRQPVLSALGIRDAIDRGQRSCVDDEVMSEHEPARSDDNNADPAPARWREPSDAIVKWSTVVAAVAAVAALVATLCQAL